MIQASREGMKMLKYVRGPPARYIDRIYFKPDDQTGTVRLRNYAFDIIEDMILLFDDSPSLFADGGSPFESAYLTIQDQIIWRITGAQMNLLDAAWGFNSVERLIHERKREPSQVVVRLPLWISRAYREAVPPPDLFRVMPLRMPVGTDLVLHVRTRHSFQVGITVELINPTYERARFYTRPTDWAVDQWITDEIKIGGLMEAPVRWRCTAQRWITKVAFKSSVPIKALRLLYQNTPLFTLNTSVLRSKGQQSEQWQGSNVYWASFLPDGIIAEGLDLWWEAEFFTPPIEGRVEVMAQDWNILRSAQDMFRFVF